ncbi:MAG: AMP-binding protein, partial [Halioglobus sp.]|nr:AMP-binding protein [Halioglobus sp.]
MSDNIKTLLDAAYDWERNAPDRLYMTQPLGNGEVAEYTWGQTLDEARRMAAYLRSLDLPPGSHIALISKNCAHFIICDLAIWMAGHATIALYPTLNADTVEYILDHSDSRLVFVGKLDDWDDIKQGIPADMPAIALPLAPEDDLPQWNDIIAQYEPITDSPARDPDELCLMCYTSGSTGRPKGVMHSFRTVSIPAQLGVADLGITSEDRMLSYLPLAHVFERANVEVSSFFSGMQIYFAETLDTFLQDLRRARPTLFISVPRLWLKFQLGVFQKMPEKRLAMLLKLPIIGKRVRKTVLEGLGLEHVRMAGSGSAPIPKELIEWYESLGVLLLEGYGMTEDFAWSHMSKPGIRRPGTVGVPAEGVETRLSEDGEIQIRSPGNMLGYYKQPELTTECYTDDGFFRTGDRGVYSPEGLLTITGRVKEIFKTSKGKYVAPAPIENLLNTDNHIELCCVSGSGRPAAHAVVQLAEEIRPRMSDAAFREEVSRQMESLLAQVNAQIEEYESLQFIAIVN